MRNKATHLAHTQIYKLVAIVNFFYVENELLKNVPFPFNEQCYYTSTRITMKYVPLLCDINSFTKIQINAFDIIIKIYILYK